MIRVLVASSYDEDRARIVAVLSGHNDLDIAGIEKDETGAIIKSECLQPDILILDLQLTGISGDELAPIIHRRSPSTAIVMLCDKDEDSYAGIALRAGISGFLLKKVDTDILVPVVKIVSSGGCYVSASITIRVFNTVTLQGQFTHQAQKTHSLFFSPAERCIIIDMASGFSDEEIAKHLNYSIGTVRNCLTVIKRKTKTKSRLQIVIFSIINGLINIGQFGTWLAKLPENKADDEKGENPKKISDRQFPINTIQ